MEGYIVFRNIATDKKKEYSKFEDLSSNHLSWSGSIVPSSVTTNLVQVESGF